MKINLINTYSAEKENEADDEVLQCGVCGGRPQWDNAPGSFQLICENFHVIAGPCKTFTQAIRMWNKLALINERVRKDNVELLNDRKDTNRRLVALHEKILYGVKKNKSDERELRWQEAVNDYDSEKRNSLKKNE